MNDTAQQKTRNIYVILSRTNTKVGLILRTFGGIRYNHASICLDDGFNEIYSYARARHISVLSGQMVKENLDRFTMHSQAPVPVEIFRIPVTEDQYLWISASVYNMYRNPEYLYNLYSLITFSFFKGFETEKAYTCTEFVTEMLQHIGLCTDKPSCSFTPDELIPRLDAFDHFAGDARIWFPDKADDTGYFDPFRPRYLMGSAKTLETITKRTASGLYHRKFGH